ncbi:hypothetical protein T03_2808 [Trichinella britovi]|uniref:Uncharacterized protein n=1 Tax=Trichinella britovi TaxID=45882 RepID=A0A0V1CC05_TRIBR|nr:hypothetical protein T03_2808 [Trichinella britovi]
MKQLPVTTHKSPVIRPSQSIYLTLPISKPAMMQLKRYQQLVKLLLERSELMCHLKRIDMVKNGASTSGQLTEQKQIKKWMALKTTDTKGKAPAMRRAHSSRRPLFPNETRLMKSAMRRVRRSEEDLPLTFL